MEIDETLREHARRLGKAGGRARAKKLSASRRKKIAVMGGVAANAGRSAKRRREIARAAAKARWLGRIAELRIHENGMRVVTFREIRRAMGIA